MRPLAMALVACWLAAPAAAQETRYEISYYDVTLTLSDGSADAEVELDVTYDVLEGVKSDGFKYVGLFQPVDVRAVDERGAPLRVGVEREREYLLRWVFPPVRGGSQRVIVRFRLRDVLSGTRAGGNELSAPWIGVFRVPVRRAAYTVIFPPGFRPELRGRGAAKFTRRRVGSQESLVLLQEPLTQRDLLLRFTPGLVDHSQPAMEGPPETWPVMTVFGVAMVGLLAAVARRRYRGAGTGWSDGGCGGGGCGGGGCGGGGCGGGCGG